MLKNQPEARIIADRGFGEFRRPRGNPLTSSGREFGEGLLTRVCLTVDLLGDSL
jgi:hypothetical protein